MATHQMQLGVWWWGGGRGQEFAATHQAKYWGRGEGGTACKVSLWRGLHHMLMCAALTLKP